MAKKDDVVLMQELAADIFQGQLGPKIIQAAVVASGVFDPHSLYRIYYGLSSLDPASSSDKIKKVIKEYARKHEWRGSPQSGFVALNGRQIEAAMIWTSHNLIQLFSALDIELSDDVLLTMATRCFRRVLHLLEFPERIPAWKKRLARAKNAAYAWRQMVFFLSQVVAPDVVRDRWLPHILDDFLKSLDDAFRERFKPALRGLQKAIVHKTTPTQIFTGWTPVWNHWVLPPSRWKSLEGGDNQAERANAVEKDRDEEMEEVDHRLGKEARAKERMLHLKLASQSRSRVEGKRKRSDRF